MPVHTEMIVFGHSDLAGENNEETRSNLACSRQLLASRKRTRVAKPAHTFDLRRIEFEKYLIVALVEGRLQ